MRLVRGSRYDALYARYQEVCEERDEAVKAGDEQVCTIVRLARENDALRETTQTIPVPQSTQDEKLRASRAENDQLRAEKRRLELDLARLQARLDDAVGLNSAEMQATDALWQGRRADVPRPRAPKEGSS